MLPEDEEPMVGDRQINIRISDGMFESSATVTVNVVPLNNNPPEIRFAGSSIVSFTEGSTAPVQLGSLLAPVISDADNNTLFLMERASVQLLNDIDGLDEVLHFNAEIVHSLAISVDRMLLYYFILPFHSCSFFHRLSSQPIVPRQC